MAPTTMTQKSVTELQHEDCCWFENGKRIRIHRDRLLEDIERYAGMLYTEADRLAELQGVLLTRRNKLAQERARTRLSVREKNEGKRLTEADVEALIETEPKIMLLGNAVEAGEVAVNAAQARVEAARAFGRMLDLAVRVALPRVKPVVCAQGGLQTFLAGFGQAQSQDKPLHTSATN